jgi:hypothetical protein
VRTGCAPQFNSTGRASAERFDDDAAESPVSRRRPWALTTSKPKLTGSGGGKTEVLARRGNIHQRVLDP